MDQIRQIDSDRLLLRALDLKDAERVTELLSDKSIYLMTSRIPYPYTLDSAKEFISMLKESDTNIVWGIVLKETETLIGAIGLIVNPQDENAELGYWIGKEYWGNGYCTEAAKEAVNYAFEKLKLNRLYANHFLQNPASGNVLKKIGMAYEGRQRKHLKKDDEFIDLELYGILYDDWNR
jgi:RimJ/RimL family protein N-acetyltransferase